MRSAVLCAAQFALSLAEETEKETQVAVATPRFTFTSGDVTYNLAPILGIFVLLYGLRVVGLLFSDDSGGYGASSSSGYGAPASSGYNAPAQSGYNAPAQSGYNAPAQNIQSGYNNPVSNSNNFAHVGLPSQYNNNNNNNNNNFGNSNLLSSFKSNNNFNNNQGNNYNNNGLSNNNNNNNFLVTTNNNNNLNNNAVNANNNGAFYNTYSAFNRKDILEYALSDLLGTSQDNEEIYNPLLYKRSFKAAKK